MRGTLRLALCPLVLFVMAIPALAGSARTEPHPDAPEQTAQYAFLIGSWDCTTRFLSADGYVDGTAIWSGWYILDGWAIQDLWVSDRPGGGKWFGTNIRSFNPETGVWDNRWLPQGTLQWKSYRSEMVGETMVMTGGEGKDPRGAFIDRNTFYEIGKDGWKWRKDRSYDGGQTWVEGVGFITATRSGLKQEPRRPTP